MPTKTRKLKKNEPLPAALEPEPSGDWPDDVPLLLADDLGWEFVAKDGRKDLAAWCDATFPESPACLASQKRWRAFVDALLGVLSERLGEKQTSLWLFLETAKKRGKPSLAWQAAAWNEALARVGYRVGERVRCCPKG